MPSKIEVLQEIADRGIQDKLSPDKREIFDELVSRGVIKTKEEFTPFGAVPESFQGETGTPLPDLEEFGRSAAGESIRTVGGLPQPFLGMIGQESVQTSPETLQLIKGKVEKGETLSPAEARSYLGQFRLGTMLQEKIGETAEAVEGGADSLGGRIVGGAAPFLLLGRPPATARMAQRLGQTAQLGGLAGASRYLPEDSPTARALEITKSTAAALAVGGAFEIGGKVIGSLAPKALTGIEKILRPSDKTKVSRQRLALAEFKNLERQSGKKIDALLSEQLGSPRVAAFEEVLKKSSSTADIAYNETQRLTESVYKDLENVVTKLAKTPKSPEATGRLIKRSFQRALNLARLNRTAEAASTQPGGYGAVKEVIGDREVILNDNLVKAYEESIRTAMNAGKRSLARKMANELRTVAGRQRNIDDAIALRSHYSKASQGTGRVVDDALDVKDSSRFARKFLEAYNKDISAAEKTGEWGDLLRQANQKYAKNSQAIESIKDTTIGRLLNLKQDAPIEDFATKLPKMTPSQINRAIEIMEPVYPGVRRRVGRFVIDETIRKARLGPQAPATAAKFRGEVVDTAKFIDKMPKDETFMSLFKGKTRQEVKTILSRMERIADRTGRGGAAGNPASDMKDAFGILGGAGQGQSGVFMARFASFPFYRAFMMKALFTEEGRRAMLKITNPKGLSAGTLAASLQVFDELND